MKLGPATMVISLPSKWIKHTGLKQGQEIDLIEKENTLTIVNPKTYKSMKETTIELNAENIKDIEVILTHLYRQGFDTIILKNIDPQSAQEIKNIVKDLILGFEITSKDNKIWKLENIASPTEEKYDTMLRRSFLIIKESLAIITDSVKNEKARSDIEELKKQHDKYILYCKRSITKESRKNLVIEWEMLTFLRHIEHSIYYLSKEMDKGIEKDPKLLHMLTKLQDYFDLYYDAYFSKDINSIHKVNRLKKEYQFGECLDLIEKGKNKRVYVYIREIFRLTQIGTSPIFQLILESSAS